MKMHWIVISALAISIITPKTGEAADDLAKSRVSMLYREDARTLVFAVSHPTPRCTNISYSRGKDGLVYLQAPQDTGNCKRKKISSLVRIQVSDKEILDGQVRIIPPPEWGSNNAKAEYVFGIRGSIVDPFAEEREKILRRKQ